MLADSMPWFLPVFVFSLLAWIFYSPLEKRLLGYDSGGWKKVTLLLRWLPPAQVLIMIFFRVQAIATRDASHNEITRYLGKGSSSIDDFKLLLTGDGGIEIMVLIALIFAIMSHKLPSLKHVREELQIAFRNRMMMFSAFFLLTSSALFFPEDAYARSEPLPIQTIGEIPEWSSFIPVGLIFALLMFNGELFAVTSLFLSGDVFNKISRRAKAKVFTLCILSLLFLSARFDLGKSGIHQFIEGDYALPLVLLVHIGICFGLILQPSVRFDSELNHGENRSFGILVLSAVFGLITLVLTPMHLDALGVFGPDLGPYTFGVWIAAITFASTMLVQYLPTLGFDAAPRPELWWMKMILTFAPVLLSMFTSFALYLIPAIWIALPFSSLTPWVIEKDCTTPSKSFVLAPFIVAIIATSIVPFFSPEPFLGALMLGWIPGGIVTIGLSLHIREISAAEN